MNVSLHVYGTTGHSVRQAFGRFTYRSKDDELRKRCNLPNPPQETDR